MDFQVSKWSWLVVGLPVLTLAEKYLLSLESRSWQKYQMFPFMIGFQNPAFSFTCYEDIRKWLLKRYSGRYSGRLCICSKTGDCWFPIILELKSSKLNGFDRFAQWSQPAETFWRLLLMSFLLGISYGGLVFFKFCCSCNNCLGNTPALTWEIRKLGNLPRCVRADRDQHTANQPADQGASELDNIANGPCRSDTVAAPLPAGPFVAQDLDFKWGTLALWAYQLSQSPTGKRCCKSLY